MLLSVMRLGIILSRRGESHEMGMRIYIVPSYAPLAIFFP